MTTISMIGLDEVSPDLLAEIDSPASEWTAWEAPYAAATVANQKYHVIHHAAAQRGGIVFVGSGSSGVTSWTDAATADEVFERFIADNMAA